MIKKLGITRLICEDGSFWEVSKTGVQSIELYDPQLPHSAGYFHMCVSQYEPSYIVSGKNEYGETFAIIVPYGSVSAVWGNI